MLKPAWNFTQIAGVLLVSPDDFETMMRETGPRVYTLAVRLAGNAADGQDLAQETYVKAYKAWSRFRGESDPMTWLYRICMNCWKNRVRSEKRRSWWRHFSLDAMNKEDDAPALELAAPEPALDQGLEASGQQAMVQAALAKLEAQDRAILVLRELEERSYEEIAEFLEIPIGTVRSRLSRSRDKLRELLKDL